MKIDKIYVLCCKLDFYLTRICIASIRYWNKDIPVFLVKDFSKGDFDTRELETNFTVSIAPMPFKYLGPYGKVYPFVEASNTRILVLDSDIVLVRNIIKDLEVFSEDLIIQSFYPADVNKEMNLWYFNTENLYKHYPAYQYPGFLFNGGQFVCNSAVFSLSDFNDSIDWKERAEPRHENTFLCEDQGVLNYAIAKKINAGFSNYRHYQFYTWGFDTIVNDISIKKNNSNHLPPLIHWLGKKTGLISGLPGQHILNFYENYYYSKISKGQFKKHLTRLKRTFNHPINYLKFVLKKIVR